MFDDHFDGLVWTESHRNTFIGNTLTNSSHPNLQIEQSNQNEFRGNHLQNTASAAMEFEEAHKNGLRGNSVRSCAGELEFETSNHNRLDQNDLEDTGGLSLRDCTKNVGRGNRSMDNSGDPIVSTGGADDEIEVNGVLRTEDNA